MSGEKLVRIAPPIKWIAFVVLVGTVMGVVLALIPRREFRTDLFRLLTNIDIVVTTQIFALAVALVYLYAKTHSETRAPFALGLLFVLSSFLFHTILTHPIFYAVFGSLSFGILFTLPVHVFEVV